MALSPHLFRSNVAEDGTLRRIVNWDLLSPAEQAVAFRRIAKRNKERLETLQLIQGMQEEPSSVRDSNNTGQEVYAFKASDFVFIALLAVVLIYVLPSKLYRLLRRQSKKQSTSD